MPYISLAAAFGAGLLSFLSPCVLPLVPVYLASLAGPEALNAKAGKRMTLFFHSLCFVAGFSLVFVLLGAGAGLAGLALTANLAKMRQAAGILLIVLGVLMLASLKIPWLNYEKRLMPSLGKTTGYLRSFIIGAVFPIAWIPCTSWQLGAILTLAGTAATAWRGAYLLAAYSLGLGIPFLAMGLAFDTTRRLLRGVGKYSAWLYLTGGLFLVIMGILILLNKVHWFA
jgi:cytochrome c-type biogenesis protein